ncbi:hypothetical protein [Ligilactobacillus saerimneri]|uniref:hypothetical protein n=1 Tax=Ligilactobacillus saerimneri TaxID=228229 RepID=UPI000426E5A2|nr:hypothetical protein [Ligilactobacillus saerimneri]KRL72487.1 hypothetical protein FC54_GL001069 [Ligilactobacillus saerimneri DSM 16049]
MKDKKKMINLIGTMIAEISWLDDKKFDVKKIIHNNLDTCEELFTAGEVGEILAQATYVDLGYQFQVGNGEKAIQELTGAIEKVFKNNFENGEKNE